MARWQSILGGITSDVENHYDHLKERLGGVLGSQDPLMILPYHGYGRPGRLLIRGRVLEDEGIRGARDDDGLWNNLLNMYRRLESDEIPFARVLVHYQGEAVEAVADEEGFFTVQLEPAERASARQLWHQVELELVEPIRDEDSPVRATGQILVPPTSAQFGVISDIDDTVVRSHATDLLRMARVVFLGNARTRLPFPGVAALYRALQGGARGDAQNPIFYLSSSPWNLYDLLLEFFRLHEIPIGPFFLRDWGLTPTEILPTQHSDYKLSALRNILEFYPDLPFILIGDSGQEDPEIYRALVDEYPDRIMTVYIRDVTPDARDKAVKLLAEEVARAQSTLILAPDSLAMAQHAATQGWIKEEMVEHVAADVREDQAEPTVVEALLDEAT